MEIVLVGVMLLAVTAGLLYALFRRKAHQQKYNKTSTLLSSITLSDEDVDADAEIREIRSREYRFYRISGFKWILSIFFSTVFLMLATVEYWVRYYPPPEMGKEYPITLKAAYPFKPSTINPVYNKSRPTYLNRGDIVIERGRTVGAADVKLVQEYAGQAKFPEFTKLVGFFVQFLSFTLLLIFWLTQFFQEGRLEENRNLVFVFCSILLVVATAKFIYLTGFVSHYFVPVSMLAMLVIILIYNKIVPSVIIFASLFAAAITEFDIPILLVLFGGGMVTIFLLPKVRKRNQLIVAGCFIGVVNLVLYVSIVMAVDLCRVSSFRDLADLFLKDDAVACLLNGVFSGLATLLLIPAFEKVFGYSSPFRLMELASLDSGLLRELYLKAPGTYQHSLAVANIAEIAANEVGADALLLRVGAYYHDIGKIFKPKFFVENTGAAEDNPHSLISPYASSKILKSHVALGLELGKKSGLPRRVLDLIPQHHGTSTMDYFYEKAKKSSETGDISESYFTYPGPLPVTREAGVLMIADSVEAASRVLKDHTEETVRKMIEKIVQHKLELGQFDQSPLTLHDLRNIIYALTKALSSTSHRRVDYPKNIGISSDFSAQGERVADEEAKKADGSA